MKRISFSLKISEKSSLYPIIGLVACMVFIYISFGGFGTHYKESQMSFVRREGTQFILNGKPFYVNGWNSYWLLIQSVEEINKPRITAMFQSAVQMGLTVCRTWAFNDGAYNALQVSPGKFDERVFKVACKYNFTAEEKICFQLGDLPHQRREEVLNKPVLFTEFGLSTTNNNISSSHRNEFYKHIFDLIYKSAVKKGAGAGAFIWQLLADDMDKYGDEFGVVPKKRPALYRLLKGQSCRLAMVSRAKKWEWLHSLFQSKKESVWRVSEEDC